MQWLHWRCDGLPNTSQYPFGARIWLSRGADQDETHPVDRRRVVILHSRTKSLLLKRNSIASSACDGAGRPSSAPSRGQTTRYPMVTGSAVSNTSSSQGMPIELWHGAQPHVGPGDTEYGVLLVAVDGGWGSLFSHPWIRAAAPQALAWLVNNQSLRQAQACGSPAPAKSEVKHWLTRWLALQLQQLPTFPLQQCRLDLVLLRVQLR